MTEPQVWTLIWVFAALMLGGMTLMTTLLMRTITTSVGGLRGEMNARFEAVDARFDAVHARFETVEVKLEHLDRDLQAISRRVFDGDPK